MKPKQLEQKFTATTEFYYFMMALLPMIFIIPIVSHNNTSGWVFLLMALVIVGCASWLVYRYYSCDQRLEEHASQLALLADTHNWELRTNQTLLGFPPELNNISLLLIADRDQQCVNYLLTPDWNYIDLSYCVYQHTKSGEYKSAYVYYSVLVTKLPRVLPNIFFDSKTQGGRQYKAKFANDQRHSLEGDFDNFFDTYFAEGYTIDSMSFITPDVMLALEAASDYDIEIKGDRLLMYGPVYVDTSKVTDGAAKLLAILRTLQLAAKAYDDERLPGVAGKQTVTPQGMQLRRKSSVAWVAVIFIVVYIIIRTMVWLQHR